MHKNLVQDSAFFLCKALHFYFAIHILTDLKGNIIFETSKQISDHSYDAVLRKIKKMIKELIASSPDSPHGIVGIGIGVPGLVNIDSEILIAPNLGWRNVNIKDEIESYFSIPVVVENEANAGAYGEKIFGAGNQSNNILYISAGIGIGAGIILNNELYSGINGFSGEIGHTIIIVEGKQCSCGSKGCWELYASEKALLDEARKLNLPIIQENDLSIEGLISFANNGNKEVIEIFNKIGKYLGIGINNMINTFNPGQIIIGNRLALAKEWIEPAVKEFVESHKLKYHQNDLSIDTSHLGPYSTSIGVSALSIENFLKKSVQ
jgi:glucokinase-like ROK family protein